MKVLGIRFCSVSPDAKAFAEFLGEGLGLPMSDAYSASNEGDEFTGAVFPAGESWIEI